MERRTAYDDDPTSFCSKWEKDSKQIVEKAAELALPHRVRRQKA